MRRAELETVLAAHAACVLASMVTGFAYGMHAPRELVVAHGWRLAGLLSLPGAVLGVGAMVVAGILPRALRRSEPWARRHVGGLAAALAVAPPSALLWLTLVVQVERRAQGHFHHAGMAALLLGTLYGAAAVTLAGVCLWAGARLADRLGRRHLPLARALGEPGLLGFGAAVGLFAYGVASGDELGRGGAFAVYAVLRHPAVDLIPLLMLACIVGGTVVGTFALRGHGTRAAPLALALAATLTVANAKRYGDSPAGARIDARPGPVQSLVEALRRASDRDGDGHSAYFGGGDCDDGDARRHPDARELPGNGVDEDCSGRDATAASLAREATRGVTAARPAALPSDLNLVLLTVDTLRADMVGGAAARFAPNLARLAAEGVTFERAYALSSNTMHAIGPLLTGRYPTECPRDDQHFTTYLPENVFLAERLRARGFWTSAMATHWYFEPSYGLMQGVAEVDGAAQMAGVDSPNHAWDHRLADRMISTLQRPETVGGRFFLWAHFFDPHNPYASHPGVGPDGDDDRAAYEREVAFTDQQIGRVLEALARHPAAGRTVVVLTADHGEAFGEHGNHWHGQELWEELIHVPLVVRAPGLAPRRVSTPRSQIDLAPTLLALMDVAAPDVDAPDALSGESLVPDLVGAAAPARPLYLELTPDRYNRLRRAYLDGDTKLLERGAGRYELYDLAADPDERRDLARRDAAALDRMLTLRERLRARLRDVAPVRGVPR